MEGSENGDKYEVDARLIYENQSDEIKEKLGKTSNSFDYFYYVDGVEIPSYGEEKELRLGYSIYTVNE